MTRPSPAKTGRKPRKLTPMRLTILVRFADGVVDKRIPALRVDGSALAIHKRYKSEFDWNLTHIPSGRSFPIRDSWLDPFVTKSLVTRLARALLDIAEPDVLSRDMPKRNDSKWHKRVAGWWEMAKGKVRDQESARRTRAMQRKAKQPTRRKAGREKGKR